MKRYHRIICLFILALSGAASVALGKDGNWDLLNYHFYNPYALLTGRLATDFLPAQTQTYINPLMDIPTYLMITGFRPVAIGGVMGVLHGLNLVFVYLITLRLFQRLPPRMAAAAAAAVTVLSATGSIFRGLLGGFMGDLTMSVFVLAAFYALMSGLDGEQGRARMRRIAAAGLLIGIATGLKTTALFHAIPLVGLSFFVGTAFRERSRTLIVCGVGFAAGFMLTYGYWAVILQARFGSPFFPYYNGLFRSPFAVAQNLTDFLHWMPQTPLANLTLPFTFLLPGGGAGQAEIFFREWRPEIAFIALILLGVGLPLRWMSVRAGRRDGPRAAPTLILGVFFFVSWAIWQAVFSYYRYLAALELLAPLLVAAAAYLLVPRVRVLALTLFVLFVLLVPTTVPLDYGRKPWTDDYFEVRIPPSLELDGAQIFIADLDRPLAYLIPFFPASVQVLRLTSNMDPLLYGSDSRGQLIDGILRETGRSGRKYAMFVNRRYPGADATRADVIPRVQNVLHRYGLEMNTQACGKIESAFHVVTLCEAAPVGQ